MPVNFGALFEQSPNAYMVLDRRLRYVAANAAYRQVTATPAEDLIGRPLFDVFPNDPEDPNNDSARLVRRSLERVLQTGQPDVLAFVRYKVPQDVGGRVESVDRYWSATHTPILDAGGRVGYVMQHTVDVTELHKGRRAEGTATAGAQMEADVLGRAERVQQDNVTLDVERRQLREIFEQAPGFMCFLRGPELVFEIANAAYHQLVGHREIIGRPIREALPELGGQGFLELLEHVFISGEPYAGSGAKVLLQRTPDAAPEEAFVDFSYQPIAAPSAGIAGVLVQGYDITRQMRQELERTALFERERAARAAAEAAEQRQRFLAESIPQQVWTALPSGDLDFISQRVVHYFGVASPADLLRDGWRSFVHAEDIGPVSDRWSHSLRTGEPYEVEFRLRRADGAYRWHLSRAVALCGADGGVEKWFGTNTDMDDLTRAREELRVRAEFDQQLIGIVSHDLRNPLNAIGMATALLLQRGRLEDQHVRIVRRIMSSSERAVRLIRDFLDFTQARVSGRIPIVPGPANLREIARQAFDEVHLAFPARTASVEHDGEEGGVWDADRIQQLIGNLVSNAFQHGAEGGTVTLRTRGRQDEMTIEVHNEGAPIPAEDFARLFEPFQRGAHASSQSGRSIGLGLHISRQIALAHGGRIDVRSTADAGTTFIVQLPRATAEGGPTP